MKFLPLFLLLSVHLFAQKKPSAPSMPDIAAMQKMTPQQLEAYKQKLLKQYSRQAKNLAAENNIKIDETALPGFTIEPPVKDAAKLALLPKQPPTLIQLADGLRAAKRNLESVASKEMIDEVQKITTTQNAAQQQSSAVAAFYNDKPAEALLLSMNATLKNVEEPIGWNNLAALYNMSGLSEKAVPILMNQLQSLPNNAMLLNNMGQAYLNLGDVTTSKVFLERCLSVDPMNPEANHSMGLINFFQSQFDEGQKYFEKELEVVHRRSTLALLKQKGKPANLYLLRQRRTNVPHRNYFDEINLSKFVMPDFPKSTDDKGAAEQKAAGFVKSVAAEQLFWQKAATERTEEDSKIERYQNVSIYSDLVDELLQGLKTTFPAENMYFFTNSDLAELKAKQEAYYKHLNETSCPEPPPNSHNDVWEAHKQKCCEMKKPITDAFVADYNAFVAAHIEVVQGRWKDYINSLISIVHLDPSPGNKKLVYASVAEYFNMLQLGWGAGMFLNAPPECHTKYTAEEATAIIESSRNIDFNCPGWMNMSISLGIASLKTSCKTYSIEGGEFFQGSYEKNFKTGTSTIAGGIGIGANFNGLLKASASQMIYVSYDKDNNFSDAGLTGSVGATLGWKSESLITDGIGKISGTIAGINGGYTVGMNAGFTGSIKTKGVLDNFIKLECSSK